MEPVLVEEELGHGALASKLDLRDKKYSEIARASAPFDWETGFDLDVAVAGTPSKTKNQGASYSCGGQSGSYYSAVIEMLYSGEPQEKSAKYIYSQIFYPQGGTTMRDILSFLVNKGDALESQVPSYQNGMPPSEAFMTDESLDTELADLSAEKCKAVGYAFVDADIDSYAQAIRDNHGAIMQINGENNGTWLSSFPVPPYKGGEEWSHFVFAKKAKLIGGNKFIGIKNSWGEKCGEDGLQWISEDYFKAGKVFKGGVVYAKNSSVVEEKITLYKKAIALCQQIINLLTGPTKKV